MEINAPADKVWAVIGNFQDMSWLPPVEKTEGTGGNEPDKATRVLPEGRRAGRGGPVQVLRREEELLVPDH